MPWLMKDSIGFAAVCFLHVHVVRSAQPYNMLLRGQRLLRRCSMCAPGQGAAGSPTPPQDGWISSPADRKLKQPDDPGLEQS